MEVELGQNQMECESANKKLKEAQASLKRYV